MAILVSLASCLSLQRNAGLAAQAYHLFDLPKLQTMIQACSTTLLFCSHEACLTSVSAKPRMGWSSESSMAVCIRKLLMVVGPCLQGVLRTFLSFLYVPDPGHG